MILNKLSPFHAARGRGRAEEKHSLEQGEWSALRGHLWKGEPSWTSGKASVSRWTGQDAGAEAEERRRRKEDYLNLIAFQI